jgi:RNA polymerase sigma-70 factor (ECF subfamily)
MEVIKLHDQYYEKVRRFIVSHIRDEWIADDLVQETFIKIDKHISSVRDKGSLSSWIYKIAYHVCLDYLKQHQTRLFKKSEQISSQTAGVEIGKSMEQYQMGACVRDKIDMLPENLRLVLVLFDLEGFSHLEISNILDISRENAKTRLHRARKRLRQILEKDCSFEKDGRDVLVCLPKKDGIGDTARYKTYFPNVNIIHP